MEREALDLAVAPTKLARYFPPMVGEIEAGVLPAEWLPQPAGS